MRRAVDGSQRDGCAPARTETPRRGKRGHQQADSGMKYLADDLYSSA